MTFRVTVFYADTEVIREIEAHHWTVNSSGALVFQTERGQSVEAFGPGFWVWVGNGEA